MVEYTVCGTACTGCSACAVVCPKKAIVMKSDEWGFLYPQIQKDRCVKCGICEKTCPVLHMPTVSERTVAFAAYAKEDSLLNQSSSGAIFPLLAKRILEQGGIVFGATFDKNFVVKHQGIETVENLPSLLSSKYVQSEIGNTYREAKEALMSRRLVYFGGTPCQIAGLKAYLKYDYDNLIVSDLICHGVPSPKVWQDYIRTLEKTYGGKTTAFSFRHKKLGWEKYGICAEFDNGAEYFCNNMENSYQLGFIKGLYSRKSCYTCPFKGTERVSDITLADFWGVQNILSEAYNSNGTSLVLLHSSKAKKLFDEISNDILSFPVDKNEAVIWNVSAVQALKKPTKYDYFYKHYKMENFEKLVQTCCRSTISEKLDVVWHRSIPYRAINKIVSKLKNIFERVCEKSV